MNRELYIRNLRVIRSKIGRLMLESSLDNSSELTEKDKNITRTFLEKVSKDATTLKNERAKVISQIGADKYNKAVSLGIKELTKKINDVKLKIKSSINKSETGKKYLIEEVSEALYVTVLELLDTVYTFLADVSLKETTKDNFKHMSLFLSVFICNSVWANVLAAFLGLEKGFMITAVVVAPLNEEAAKQVSLRISHSSGLSYTFKFAALEAVHYIVSVVATYGSQTLPYIVFIRLEGIIFHMFTAILQLGLSVISDDKLRAFSFLIGVIIHAAANAGLTATYLFPIMDKVFGKDWKKAFPEGVE